MVARALAAVFLIGILGALGLSDCTWSEPPVSTVSLDFPHGDLRLRVARGGSTHLFYGAHPEPQAIADGTFDLDILLSELRPRLHPLLTNDQRPPGEPYGLVTMTFADGSQTEYLLYDGSYAAGLFQQACAKRVTTGPFPADLVDRVCADRFAPSP